MWLYSIVSYVHIIAIIVVFSSLLIEISYLNDKMTIQSVRTLTKADMFFGISAVVTVISGILRMLYFGKGIEFYLSNPLFIIKLSTFIGIGLLSIYPTITFIRAKKTKQKIMFIKHFKTIKMILIFELALLFLIPFLAILVTNGLGN